VLLAVAAAAVVVAQAAALAVLEVVVTVLRQHLLMEPLTLAVAVAVVGLSRAWQVVLASLS